MKIIVAIDSLKGSLDSLEAGAAIKTGVNHVFPEAEVCVSPLADGGEGTLDALINGIGGNVVSIPVTGPHGRQIEGRYGVLEENQTAVIEIASAAGITLVQGEERNPLHTTTYGVGELIVDAVKRGCRNFIIGLGGSATNDGGAGMLQALGYGLLDERDGQIPQGAKGLAALKRVTVDNVLPELSECTFQVACDVTNPLCGEEGASAVYGPQKGATEEMVKDMDGWLSHYATVVAETYKEANPEAPGTGAAGGLGFAFLTFMNSELKPGIDIVIKETQLEKKITDADIVITGEGRLDGQSVMGKAPIGVAKLAKKYGKKVIAFSGCVTPDAVKCNEAGIDAYFPILREVISLEEAMDKKVAKNNLIATVEQVFRLIRVYV